MDISRRDFLKGTASNAALPLFAKWLKIPGHTTDHDTTEEGIDRKNYTTLFGSPGEVSDRARRAAEKICANSMAQMEFKPWISKMGVPWDRIEEGVLKAAALFDRYGIPPERALGGVLIVPQNLRSKYGSGYNTVDDNVHLGTRTLQRADLPNIVLHELVHRLFMSPIGYPGEQKLREDFYYGKNAEVPFNRKYTWEDPSELSTKKRRLVPPYSYEYPDLRNKAPSSYGASDALAGYPIEYPTTVIQSVADRYDGQRKSWIPNPVPEAGVGEIDQLLRLIGSNIGAEPNYEVEAFPLHSYTREEVADIYDKTKDSIKLLLIRKRDLDHRLNAFHNAALTLLWAKRNPQKVSAEGITSLERAQKDLSHSTLVPDNIVYGDEATLMEALKHPVRRTPSTAFREPNILDRSRYKEYTEMDMEDLTPPIAWSVEHTED